VTTIRAALVDGPVVLDGGLATQLEAQGNDLGTELWSARLLLDDPDEVLAAHQAFYRAGAQVAISASYQASFPGLARLGLSTTEAADVIRRSVAIARAAGDVGDGVRRWVAGSVGPYGAALADGSEYRGDYDVGVRELREWHRPRLEVLSESGADLLALETIPCLTEVEALLSEVAGTGVPVWLSLTCATGRTRAGEPVEEAFTMAREVDEVFAVGVNCTEAHEAGALVAVAADTTGLPVVVYPNSGEDWDAQRHTWTGRPSYDPEQIDGWLAAGARLVGGCCRVGPAQISEIAKRVRDRAA
jgi:homocysteine S-methyltransferase